MAKSVQELESAAQRINSTYILRFAEQPRITRDPSVLDKMIADSKALLEDLKRARKTGKRLPADLRKNVKERLSLYETEKGAVKQAQGAGANAVEAARLGHRANNVFYGYARHFAGQSRETRDLGLMDEIVENLEGILGEMEALERTYGALEGLTRDQGVVKERLELYRSERTKIGDAYGDGEPDQRSGRLATLANAQFQIYRNHFAGKSRLSRRPSLIQRVIKGLAKIEDDMNTLKSGGKLSSDASGHNDANIKIVIDRRSAYEAELVEIRKAKESEDLDRIVRAFGEAVDQVMSEYGENFAGKDRGTRDLNLLSSLCDRMGECENQLTKLLEIRESTQNEHNLAVSRDMQHLLEREWRKIKEIKEK